MADKRRINAGSTPYQHRSCRRKVTKHNDPQPSPSTATLSTPLFRLSAPKSQYPSTDTATKHTIAKAMPLFNQDFNTADGPYHARFREMAKEIDAHNEKRERLVRASRDVTSASKKIIFDLHRADTADKATVMKRASAAIRVVLSQIAAKIAVEMADDSDVRFRKFYSPGMQEFVEAREMLEYMRNGKMAGFTKLQEELMEACNLSGHGRVVRLEEADYVLGVADLTGECMRMAVQRAGKGEVMEVSDIMTFVTDIWVWMSVMEEKKSFEGKDFATKMRVMRSSLEKVEKSAYQIKIRMAESGAQAWDGNKKTKLS